MHTISKNMRYFLMLPFLVLVMGTIGFMLLENLSFLDALYFTVVTITTVGYGDITPVTTGGKIFAMIVIIFGISSFVSILTNLFQWFIRRGELNLHRHRMNMLTGVFFTEAGNELLRIFSRFDPHVETVRHQFMVTPEWTAEQFKNLKTHLSGYHYNVDIALIELDSLKEFLREKGDMLIRQLENPDIEEREEFSELLWAIVHLRDELVARKTFDSLPETDLSHIVVDIKRAYSLLTRLWLDYMLYLQNRYPFLFSLALRTNPFVENPSVVVQT